MPAEWKPPKSDADVFAQYKGHVEGERELKPKMEEAADRALASGATVGQLARHTGLTPEVFRRRARKLGIEHKRAPTVGKLTQPPAAAPEPRPAPTLRRAPAPKWKPEPTVEGRPLLEDEAQKFAALARSRATALQNKGLDQATGSVGDGIKDYVVVSEALSMGLLTHDEVYGPASTEEGTG